MLSSVLPFRKHLPILHAVWGIRTCITERTPPWRIFFSSLWSMNTCFARALHKSVVTSRARTATVVCRRRVNWLERTIVSKTRTDKNEKLGNRETLYSHSHSHCCRARRDNSALCNTYCCWISYLSGTRGVSCEPLVVSCRRGILV
jgi:hypothetical protein